VGSCTNLQFQTMTNFSQCPGEAYDVFWDEPIQSDAFTINEILRRYQEMRDQRPSYYKLCASNSKNQTEDLVAKFDSFETAIKLASMLHETGCWVVNSLTKEQ
jgi:hypothetical protein